MLPLPHVTVVLAMSADGKISDTSRSSARFPSSQDQHHLQTRVAAADATLFGAGTLRAYGTTLSVRDAALLAQRQQQGQPAQPSQIVCSASGQLDPSWRFFAQPVPRWLLTSPAGASQWATICEQAKIQTEDEPFQQVLPWLTSPTDWQTILSQLKAQGTDQLLVMGGGKLVAALAAADVVDELWLTVCPLLIGGRHAPTPVDGDGFQLSVAPRLQLLSAETVNDEVFLHYRRSR